MYSPDLVATKTLWESFASLLHQGSLVIAPKRPPAHSGGLTLASFLGIFAVECKLLELGEARVAKAVVPLHELGFFIGSGKLGVLSFLEGR
jgi:hypothetical protein